MAVSLKTNNMLIQLSVDSAQRKKKQKKLFYKRNMLVQAENSKRGNRFRSGLSTAALDRLSQQLAQKGLALLTQSFYCTKEKDTGNKFLRSTLIFSIFNKCHTDIYSFTKVG